MVRARRRVLGNLALLLSALAALATLSTLSAATGAVTVRLQNPMQLFNTTGDRMNVHDGDVRQWTQGGECACWGCSQTFVYRDSA